MCDVWEFRRDDDGFRWRRLDRRGVEIASSAHSEARPEECVADARAHGFGASEPSSESSRI